jgi:uncharacterized protein YbaP (TraB family)
MNKIKIIFVWLLTACFSVALIAQEKHLERSLLWKISGNGLEKPSFLYGTIHVICPDELHISDLALQAFQNSEQLFLELDMDDPTLTSEMQRSMISSTHLRSLMKEKDYKKTSVFFKKRVGYSIDMLGMIKPFYLLSFTYSPMIGCSQPVSVEGALTKLALERKMSIGGLETLNEQITIFDKISQKEQANMLFEYVKDFDKMQETFQMMLKAYQAQDLEALMKISNTANQHTNKYESLLLDNRNEKWLNVIEAQARLQPTFFAFGAAHLVGEKGVINLLRKAGYTVEAVKKNQNLLPTTTFPFHALLCPFGWKTSTNKM